MLSKVSGSHSREVVLMWLEILKPNLGFKKIIIILTSCQTLGRLAWGMRNSGGLSELFLLPGLPSAPTTPSSWLPPLLRRVLLLLKTVPLSGIPPPQWSPLCPSSVLPPSCSCCQSLHVPYTFPPWRVSVNTDLLIGWILWILIVRHPDLSLVFLLFWLLRSFLWISHNQL